MSDIAALVSRAVQAARRLDRDPELESVVQESTLRAVRTYDPAINDSLEAWVVFVAKRDAVGYLRWRNSRKEVLRSYQQDEGEPCDHPAAPEATECRLLVDWEDWELLCEKYIEGWNFVAIARKRGVTVNKAKELVHAAVARFVRAHEARG